MTTRLESIDWKQKILFRSEVFGRFGELHCDLENVCRYVRRIAHLRALAQALHLHIQTFFNLAVQL